MILPSPGLGPCESRPLIPLVECEGQMLLGAQAQTEATVNLPGNMPPSRTPWALSWCPLTPGDPLVDTRLTPRCLGSRCPQPRVTGRVPSPSGMVGMHTPTPSAPRPQSPLGRPRAVLGVPRGLPGQEGSNCLVPMTVWEGLQLGARMSQGYLASAEGS